MTLRQLLTPTGSLLGTGSNLLDPLASSNTTRVSFTTVGPPSVAFDNQHHAFVIFTEYTPGDLSGVVLLSEYDL